MAATTATNGSPLALPEPIDRVPGEFVAAARTALGASLVAIVLYGSGAEGRHGGGRRLLALFR
jgi:hypothetical protein